MSSRGILSASNQIQREAHMNQIGIQKDIAMSFKGTQEFNRPQTMSNS